MSSGDEALAGALRYAGEHVRSVVGSLVIVGTLGPALFVAFDAFALNTLERILATTALVLGLGVVGAGMAVVYLHRDNISQSRTDLLCLAFEILNGDDGHAHDSVHSYRRQERVYDISGEQASFYNRFVGEVRHHDTSDGIRFKYIGDYGVDADDIDVTVTRHEPTEDGESVEVEPEIESNGDPYAVILKLPFGRTLTGGEKFDIEIECEAMGETPTDKSIARVHFPMHRYQQIETFDATIRVRSDFVLDDCAQVSLTQDLSQHRNVRVEDLLLESVDCTENGRTDVREYEIHENNANNLYLFRFLKQQ